MAVLVGLLVGVVTGFRRAHVPFALVLVLPLLMAAVEIVVNTVRFGLASMLVWAPLLVGLTVTATAVAHWLGGRVGRGRAAVEPPS